MLTASGKKASLAALAREHEYQDWLGLRCGDQECTWAAFMAERRASKERERKRKLGENRTAQRRAEQTNPTYLHRQDHFAAWLRSRPDQAAQPGWWATFMREMREQQKQRAQSAAPRFRIRRGLEQEYTSWCEEVRVTRALLISPLTGSLL